MRVKATVLLIILYNSFLLVTGYFGWPMQFCLNSISSCILFYYIREKDLMYKVPFLISAIFFLGMAIYTKNFHVLPIVIVPFVFFGLSFIFTKVRFKFYSSVALLLLLAISSFWAMSAFLTYYFNRPLRDLIGEKLPHIEVVDEYGLKDDSIFQLTNTLIVIDLWSTNCGICLNKFPKYSTLQDSFKDKNILFYTLNLPIKKDRIGTAKELLTKFYNKSNNLFAIQVESWKALEIHGVPQYLIIRNGKIKYLGYLEIDRNLFEHDLYDEIENQLEDL
ncbi:MAG: hypothetical protein CFE21_16835 [Bacteroidetes bacterium B1(2017)]|nr:MAG: hypothetical protein CFE21_16835 [Bacteroidetes bacterium B1(2017)]